MQSEEKRKIIFGINLYINQPFTCNIIIGEYAYQKNFTNHVLNVTGDVIYLFSNSYADQFGGQKSKKFKYAQLKELLLSIHKKPMAEQKEILYLTFENWKGKDEQTDDICVMGVRV